MKLALFGSGGHALEVAAQIGKPLTFFVDDKYSTKKFLPISSFNPNKYQIMIAVGDCKKRNFIVKKMPKETKYFTFIHPTALIMDKNIKIDHGSFIGAYSILTTNIKIGKHAILNRGNHIGHDTVIGDFFSAMPSSIISGNVTVGNRVYLGTNSSIIEKVKIGNDIIIGAGGVVINNLDKKGTYVGVPAKYINV